MGAGPDLYDGTAKDIIKMAIDSGALKMNLGIGAYLGLIASIVGVIGAGVNVKENLWSSKPRIPNLLQSIITNFKIILNLYPFF